jgi:hypothetical protein
MVVDPTLGDSMAKELEIIICNNLKLLLFEATIQKGSLRDELTHPVEGKSPLPVS